MKSMKKIVFLFLMATLLPLTTSAEIIKYGSLWYDMHHQPYDDYDAEVIVSQDEPYSGNIIIPQKIFYDGVYCPVTAIGSSAFEGCIGMTSVTIPSSLTTIGGAAFSGCI